MNKKKLESLAKKIEKLPRKSFNMALWAAKMDDKGDVLVASTLSSKEIKHPCGTACCIAGYQVLRTPGRVVDCSRVLYNGRPVGFVDSLAQDELDLANYEARSLFFSSNWPVTKSGKQRFRETPKGAAARIRYMIKTGV